MNTNIIFTGKLEEAYGIPVHDKRYVPNYFFRIKGNILFVYDGSSLETWGHIYEIETLDNNSIRIDFIRKDEKARDLKFIIIKDPKFTKHI